MVISIVHRRIVIQVNASKRRNIVYRQENERYNPDNIVEFTNKGYGIVMVWASIINDRKTALVIINGRLTKDITVRTF